MPKMDVPPSIWELAQKISGKSVPASFLRNEVLWPWYVSVKQHEGNVPVSPEHSSQISLDPRMNSEPAALPESHITYPETTYPVAPVTELDPPPSELSMRERKRRLDLNTNPIDTHFTIAWRWVCAEFGSEEEAVEHFEKQVSKPQGAMTNPRGVVIARWQEAGQPVLSS